MTKTIPGKKKNQSKGSHSRSQFIVDCQQPAADALLDAYVLRDFLRNNIKVENKKGNLGKKVAVKAEANKVVLDVEQPFSKRYIKYLVKKCLKREKLKEFMHVVAPSKNTYELRYLSVNEEGGEDE